MLAEINLLPKKEPKNYTFVIILSFIVLLAIAASIYMYTSYHGYKREIASLERQIFTAQEIVVMEQQKAASDQNNSSVEQLKNLVDWAENYPLEAVPLLQHMTGLLPERGFLLDFAYVKEGVIQLNIQFDTSAEASAYLSELLASDWIRDAKLSALAAGEIETQESVDRESAGDEDGAETEEPSFALDDEPYVPRYTGTFEVSLNRAAIKAEEEKKEGLSSSSEGGDGE